MATLRRFSLFLFAALAVIALALTACPGSTATTGTTPAAPVAPLDPSIVLAQAMKTVADAGDAAVDGLRVAKANGTISAADFNTAEGILAAVANAGVQIDAEQQSADLWATQKTKILAILQATGLSQLKSHVSANTYAITVGVITAVNAVSVSLGGPTI